MVHLDARVFREAHRGAQQQMYLRTGVSRLALDRLHEFIEFLPVGILPRGVQGSRLELTEP